jgi:hypothetical protein
VRAAAAAVPRQPADVDAHRPAQRYGMAVALLHVAMVSVARCGLHLLQHLD